MSENSIIRNLIGRQVEASRGICGVVRKNGQRCTNPPAPGDTLCKPHREDHDSPFDRDYR